MLNGERPLHGLESAQDVQTTGTHPDTEADQADGTPEADEGGKPASGNDLEK